MSVSEPSKILTPWATSGLKNTIPSAADPVTGKAGYDQGFPAINMTAKEAGGIPPFGQDFNGIFFDITQILQYMQAGGHPTYSSALSTAIGGYPLGAMLAKASGLGFWRNITANNTTNPDSGGAGWVSDLAGSYAGATVITAPSTSLVASKLGQAFLFTTASSTVSLPASSSVPSGGTYRLGTSSGLTLSVTGGAVMQWGADQVTTLTIPPGSDVTAISDGALWWVFGFTRRQACLVNATGTGAPNEVVASIPATISSASRYVLTNPFGNTTPVDCWAEIQVSGKWANPRWVYADNSDNSWGVAASYVQGEGIVVVTGKNGVSGQSEDSGNALNTSVTVSTAPCRVFVRKLEI